MVPVEEHMLTIRDDAGIPKYQQIYEQLKQQILDGTLAAGDALPSSRSLCMDYGISRNTVKTAYEQLAAEGYVHSIIGSGFYVESLPETYRTQAKETKPVRKNDAGFVEKEQIFRYGSLDVNIYRTRAFRRCLHNAMAELERQDVLTYQDPRGNLRLRKALAEFLSLSRGVTADASQIHITGGIQAALRTLCDLFPKDTYAFAIENPGYSGASDVFRRAGYAMHWIPLQEDGLDTSCLRNLHHTLLYATPSHQFPMGSVLPMRKRMELLQWAKDTDSWIIEDDYDSELRCHERPIPSLQSLDSSRVIYLGTFSKSLSPDLCASYMVLPGQLHVSYGSACSYFGTSVPAFEQLALAEYISCGEYQRHLSRLRTIMNKRREYILESFRRASLQNVRLLGKGGMHFILEFHSSFSNEEAVRKYVQHGLHVMSTEPFYDDPEHCPRNQILIGFGAVSLGDLASSMDALISITRELMEKS